MVANVQNIDSAGAIQKLKAALEHNYVIKDKVIRTIDHGDSSNRERVFVVGVHKRLGQDFANSFEWPRTDDKRHLEARRLAEPDEDVPEPYVRRHKSPIKVTHKPVKDMHMHKLAQLGKGMGHSSFPHSIYSWDGIWNTQTTHNGGGQRPMLAWTKGKEMYQTRLTTPKESIRIASLPDSYYELLRSIDPDDDKFIFNAVNGGVPVCTATDIYKNIHVILEKAKIPKQGAIPNQYTIDQEQPQWSTVCSTADSDWGTKTLEQCLALQSRSRGLAYNANSPRLQQVDPVLDKPPRRQGWGLDQYAHKRCMLGKCCEQTISCPNGTRLDKQVEDPYSSDRLRSMMVDSGADKTMVKDDHNPHLHKRRAANTVIHTAKEGDHMYGDYIGILATDIITPAEHLAEWTERGVGQVTPYDIEAMTVPMIGQELFSIDKPYVHGGMETFLTHPDKTGPPHMTDGVTTIPFRYDYEHGGFHMDYMRKLDYHSDTLYGIDKDRPLREHHKISIHKARCEDLEMLRAYNAQLTEQGSQANISLAEHHCYSTTVAADIDARVRDNPAVTEVVQIQHQPLPDMEAYEKASHHSNKRNVTEVYNAWHPDEREIKGVKQCLKATKKNMPIKEFHADHGHLGTCTGCWICKATKGSMRKIHKVQDPFRDTRAGYAWSMDTVTMSVR
jgi:hypothetical protein